MASVNDPHHPHAGQPVLRAGPSPRDARLVAILLHGRGASAEDILGLADQFSATDSRTSRRRRRVRPGIPIRFSQPLQQNEPWLSSALRVIEGLIEEVQQQGVPSERLALMGFSQGACLALEFAARHARRYAAVVAFSGGLIGPPGTPRNYAGTFEGTPVFLGCSDSIRTFRSSASANPASSCGAWAPASTSASTLAWLTPSSQTRSKPPMRCWQLLNLAFPVLRALSRKRGTSRGPGTRRSAPSDRRPSAPRWQWHRRRR